MKPCRANRKRIVLLAVDGLEAEAAQKLREHLRACPGCRQYRAEIAEACCDQIRAAQLLPHVEAGDRFHRRLESRIAGTAATPAVLHWAGLWSSYLNGWKVALPAAALVVVGLVLFRPGQPTHPKQSIPVASHSSAVTMTPADSPPSLGRYRSALSRSFEELDASLTKDIGRSPQAPEPIIMAALRRTDVNWP